MKVKFAEEQACVAETMSWLHDCWVHSGGAEGSQEGDVFKLSSLQPNTFYERNKELTPEVVDQVIADMEGIFATEIQKYPGYHNNAQGISTDTHHLVVAGFDKLPYPQRLAIVQGVDRIFQKHRDFAAEEAAALVVNNAPPASVDFGYMDDPNSYY